MPKIVLRIVLPLTAAIAVLLTVELLNRWATTSMGLDSTDELPFSAIRCPAPPGSEQKDFVAEVQYLSGLPDRVNVLDRQLAEKLHAAFALHPWVESVEDVTVSTQRIAVRLRFRTPLLAVWWDGRLRAVDGSGILLPVTANTKGLPMYSGKAAPPAGPAGTHWGDKAVEERARAAALDGNR
jgi:hypothetical protein